VKPFHLSLKGKKLSGPQRKIALASLIIIMAFILFTRFVYAPSKKRLDDLRKQVVAAQEEIGRIGLTLGQDKPLEEAINGLQKNISSLEETFPKREEVFLREFPRTANRLGVEIVSMTPQRKRIIGSIGEIPVSLKGYKLEEMQITMAIRCPYMMLGDYLGELREAFPVFVRIDSVQMLKITNDRTGPKLNVSLNLTVYLLNKTGS